MSETHQTCEYASWTRDGGVFCGGQATLRYPAWGGGYCYLCYAHGAKHIGTIGTEALQPDGRWLSTSPAARAATAEGGTTR